jgi:putative DNA primase/helicase
VSDPTEYFRLAIAAQGLEPPESINADGAIHRFSSSGRRGDDAGWYVLHLDGIPAGSFGCWRSGGDWPWCAKSDNTMTKSERDGHQARTKAIQMQRESEKAQRHEDARQTVATLWQQTDQVTDHPYLAAKGIKPFGARVFGDKLLIPMRDTSGTMHSLQTIDGQGDKLFHPGGRVKGCYCSIGKPDGTLIVCEGFATGASLHECSGHAVAVAFNAGNLQAVAAALREKYPKLKIIVAADDDHLTPGNPGLTKATAAAQAVGGFLAVPKFPEYRGDKHTDFNDLCQSSGAQAVQLCVEAAVCQSDTSDPSSNWLDPEPLEESHDPLPYPLEALPVTIRSAVEEVIGFVKAPIALAAASALSVVSVALQGLYDVERAPGLSGPISLYMLSIAESGERKTSCDGYFKQALEDWQREQVDLLKPLMDANAADFMAWESKKAGVMEAIKKGSKDGKPTDEHERALRDLEQSKPLRVRSPRLIRGDETPENLSWSLMRDWPSAGVLSSEAGVVFGSHGMGSDSVTRNLSLLNVLWEGGSIPVGRRTSESYVLEGARLTMGLQVQESTLRTFFDKSKGLARGTGFLARFLMAWPTSTMGTRFYSEAPDWRKLGAFKERIHQLLETELNIDDEGRLTPVMLVLSSQSHAAWVKFQNMIEAQLSPDGEMRDVKDVASKVADNAARLAAIFHVFEHGAGAVSADAMARGAKVAAWHLCEARRFLGQFAQPVGWMNAQRLDRWLIPYCVRLGVDKVSTKTAMQYGPLRDKVTLQSALEHLDERHRARSLVDGKRLWIEVNPALLEATP